MKKIFISPCDGRTASKMADMRKRYMFNLKRSDTMILLGKTKITSPCSRYDVYRQYDI